MSRLLSCFAQLSQKNQAAFIAFITAGDPGYETSLALLKKLPESGVDIIELGMPFTDPMADGPSIQKANIRALAAKQTVEKTLKMVAEFRITNQETPIILMGYFNPINAFGVPAFINRAKKAGIDGLIIVDLPFEHDADLCNPAQKGDIDFIRLTTPTTNDDRLSTILENSSGFVYYASVKGVTGALSATEDHLQQAINRLRQHTMLPICVGFGIRTPDQAANAARIADGVVVGSAIVEHMEKTTSNDQRINEVLKTCNQLSKAIHQARQK